LSRLVAVSNRVEAVRAAPLAGGLAVALVDALREQHGMWFGWSGNVFPGATRQTHVQNADGFSLVTIDLLPGEYDAYYNGFANRCLWPLFHFRLDLAVYDRNEFEAYQQVNKRFAEALMPLLQPDDLIWIHDYHLFLLASELRRLGAKQKIGFFLHIPFPPRELLVTLPRHEELVRGIFDCDLAGFQTTADVARFKNYARHEFGAKVNHGLEAFGRHLALGQFPVGIDAEQFRSFASSARGEREFQKMKDVLRGREQIIGVDRLDYSKGLLRRLIAYENMLERYPEAHGRIEFLQIAPLSRNEVEAYREFRMELEQRATRINGRFGMVDWTPLRYMNRAMSRRTLAAFYRASRIGLVTPMRDGMNLVAKEYVAAQDPDDPGVLVLSRFAGAAQQLKTAVLVNPYDAAEVADALELARNMPLEERKRRHEALLRKVMTDDATGWQRHFIDELKKAA
jgi:trehalose 6-phosphate synthase